MLSKEVPSARTPTFDDIAVENRKRLELMGIVPSNKAVVHSLMQMMSCMGELSHLAYNNEASLSPFEHSEVRAVIGKMAVCLATMGEAFDINVGHAAMESMVKQPQKTTETTSSRFPRSEEKKSAPIRVTGVGNGNEYKEPNILLSPTSNREFFGYLDELITYNKNDFENADLKWVAPLPDGTIQELIENGSTINVQYEDLPKYLDCVKQYRNARGNENFTNKRGQDNQANFSTTQSIRSAAISTAINNQLQNKEQSLFSPNNLESGLLSPNNNNNNNQAFTMTSDVSVPKVNHTPIPSTVDFAAGTSVSDFYAKVDALKHGNVTGPQIAQLNLTFSLPRNGKLVELIPNGIHVRVTSANVAEFLRLLEDKSAILNGKVRRLESIKRLEVTGAGPQDLSREKDKFSPTHFSKDIFSPYEERTTFLVDCDASEEILPAFIKEREQQKQRKIESIYVRVVRQGDVKSWRAIIERVLSDSSALKEYGVTFCVPAAVAPDTTEEEQLTGIHELMRNGTTTLVEDSQLWHFSRMIEPYYHPSV
ncbi:uncharacterized protein TM35_000021040 [Trypanosoma theileri]|uniref:HECT domain-containing protein n=1 Tax=Trypanosoma theileri TaxID=67003 RepID=A0A1X0P7D0_9TRYP|nr:uncharacterized protein TM35_000021040 [Trypanosoma theileri]ORC92778.1 hypothetical protein TM35_000021040 [Trypanosoma theileri]